MYKTLRYTHASSYVAGGGEDAIGKILDGKVGLRRHLDKRHFDHACRAKFHSAPPTPIIRIKSSAPVSRNKITTPTVFTVFDC